MTGKPKRSRNVESASAVPPVASLNRTAIEFNAIVLRSLIFQELDAEGFRAQVGDRVGDATIRIDVNGQIEILSKPADDSSRVEMKLAVRVGSLDEEKPFRVDVLLSALFSAASHEATLLQLVKYVNDAGPRTVFPYVREIVSSATSRGRFGALLLNPIVLGAIAPAERLEELVESWSATTPVS